MLYNNYPAPRWPYLLSGSQYRRYIKNKFKKKRRQIEKQGLESAKRQFNSGLNIMQLNTDEVIKDQQYIKVKSRQGLADYIERRTTNSRLTIGRYL